MFNNIKIFLIKTKINLNILSRIMKNKFELNYI